MRWVYKCGIALGAILGAVFVSFCLLASLGAIVEYINNPVRKARNLKKRLKKMLKKGDDEQALEDEIARVMGKQLQAEQGTSTTRPNITTQPQLKLFREKQEREREGGAARERVSEGPLGEKESVEVQGDGKVGEDGNVSRRSVVQEDGKQEGEIGQHGNTTRDSVVQDDGGLPGLSGSTEIPVVQDGEAYKVQRPS